jgi:pyrimidine operon attenuation protein / uracil phosphoribosyltransferase
MNKSNMTKDKPVTILKGKQLELTLQRLCFQLIENHDGFENSVIIGMQPRGIYFSRALLSRLSKITGSNKITYGELDITFYRDDFRRRDTPLIPDTMDIDFVIEDKKVILVDDVLYTGRTARAALDALLAFGRPEKVELLVLVDRRFSRHLPIEPDYVGMSVDSRVSEKVKVEWKETEGENKVLLLPINDKAS